MKTARSKEKFLQSLRGGNNVSTACKASNVSRQTVYRWQKESERFKEEMEIAHNEGDEFTNDYVENTAKQWVKDGDKTMVRYWLTHRHPKFMPKEPVQHGDPAWLEEEIERLKFQIKINEPVKVKPSVLKGMLEKQLVEVNKTVEEEIQERKALLPIYNRL